MKLRPLFLNQASPSPPWPPNQVIWSDSMRAFFILSSIFGRQPSVAYIKSSTFSHTTLPRTIDVPIYQSSLLCYTEPWTFWFQIYFLVVVFALYNGLVFLPVLLSLFGPSQRPEKKFEAVPMKTLSRGIEAADAEAESFVRTNQENNDPSENGLA